MNSENSSASIGERALRGGPPSGGERDPSSEFISEDSPEEGPEEGAEDPPGTTPTASPELEPELRCLEELRSRERCLSFSRSLSARGSRER